MNLSTVGVPMDKQGVYKQKRQLNWRFVPNKTFVYCGAKLPHVGEPALKYTLTLPVSTR